MFKLINVRKKFVGDQTIIKAVDDVSLTIKSEEIFGIIGASGAGKSTLIRCLNLLEYPDSGQVIFKGNNLLKLSNREIREMRKKIGIIFQNFNLLSSRTVFENVAFPIRNMDKKAVYKKVTSLLELVGISDKINAYPSQLSGGQKQRVAIARALANDPDVLLCDEATSALDPQSTKAILDLLKKLNQELALTVILITHEMDVIKKICDQVAIMDDGKIVEVGPVVDVFTNPKHSISRGLIHENFNLNDIYSFVEQNNLVLAESHLFELIYGQQSSSKALINSLIREFDLEVNIIAGSIEIISPTAIGHLVVIVSGEKEAIASGKQFLSQQGVIVNEVNLDA